jgi:hypothetical protein
VVGGQAYSFSLTEGADCSVCSFSALPTSSLPSASSQASVLTPLSP